jgi:hypothetical protein
MLPDSSIALSMASGKVRSRPDRSRRNAADDCADTFAAGSSDYWLAGWQSALPSHRHVVAQAERELGTLTRSAQLDLVDQLAASAGDYFVWIALLAGAAYNTEIPLADFYRRHVLPRTGGSYQPLLAGLGSPRSPASHAVTSLDWLSPTPGDFIVDWLAARRSPWWAPSPVDC